MVLEPSFCPCKNVCRNCPLHLLLGLPLNDGIIYGSTRPNSYRLTQWFDGRNPAPEEGKPVIEVPELLCGAVLEAEADEVDAVHVPDEVIVEEMVIRLSGKLPHAQLPHGPQGALQRGSRTLCH